MRSRLRWALVGTVALAAAALWWPAQRATTVQAVRRDPGQPGEAGPSSGTADLELAPLPRELAPWQIEPASRDPFAPVAPPAQPVVAAPVAPAPVVLTPPPPPPPAAPGINLRYLGRMTTPEGRHVVLLARGDAALTVQVGTTLEEGYVVQAVGSDAVRLVYPPLGTVVDVPIPTPQPQPQP